jgi:sugar fermentation stimulation protein A
MAMRFPRPLVRGRFLAREKRFLVHVRLDDGSAVIAHTNNTGRMTGALAPEAPVWLSPAADPRRRLPWTLELVETTAATAPGVAPGVLVGVNTTLANALVAEAVAAGLVPGLAGAGSPRREVRCGHGGSRIDLRYEPATGPPIWVEVKNVSLVQDGHARFPDAPSLRARRHLQELAKIVAGGERALLVFCVQRGDAVTVGPADDVDPQYGRLLRRVARAGVGVCAVGMAVSPAGIRPAAVLPVRLGRKFPTGRPDPLSS